MKFLLKMIGVIGLIMILGRQMVFVHSSFAACYTLTVPFGNTTTVSGLGDYLKAIYTFGIGAGGVLAVAMIVYGGIKYTISEAIPSKEDAIDIIRNALIGLGLLLAALVILQLINPAIEFRDPALPPLSTPPPTLDQTCNGKPDPGKHSE